MPQAPTGFDSTKVRCSAVGCSFEGDASMTAMLGPGMRPYCQHHATGGELKVADLIWRPPCACGRVADGFRQVDWRVFWDPLCREVPGANARSPGR